MTVVSILKQIDIWGHVLTGSCPRRVRGCGGNRPCGNHQDQDSPVRGGRGVRSHRIHRDRNDRIISSLKQSVEYPSTSAELVSCWSYVDAVEVLIRPPCCVMES